MKSTKASSLLAHTLAAFLIAAPLHTALAADLEFVTSLFQLNPAVDGLSGAEEVVISEDGLFAYVASEDHTWVNPPAGESGGIGIFDLDETGPSIASTMNGVVEVNGARALALSPGPANQHLYVASSTDHRIIWFTRDAVTGLLMNMQFITGTVGVIGIQQTWSVAVSADGLHVYVTGLADDSIAVFSRDTTTGSLSWVKTYFDATSMDLPTEVRLSPDDSQVFVASQGDSVSVGVAFDRDLTIPDPLVIPPTDITPPVPGLGVAKSIAVSPDNLSVYFGVQTSGAASPGIAVYDRDPITNVLSVAGFEDDGSPSTVVSLSVSPDGQSLLAAVDIDDELSSYVRASDGSLSFFETIPDGGAIPLDGATSTAITASGAFAISVAKGGSDDGMALFSLPEPGSAALWAGVLAALSSLVGGARRAGETPS